MDIVNLEQENFNLQNVIFVDGVTLDRIRMRYNWLLNACVENAIIGEDEHGLVWYFGDWLCGEWWGGTWYSGRFFDGVWFNGIWHSCKLNKFDVLNNKLNILNYNNYSSQFLNGDWENGDFYEGTFGNDIDLHWESDYSNKVAMWKYGRFHNGIFVDAKWYDGVFNYGYMKNSQWFKGDFFNGTFDGGNTLNEKSNWYKGSWYGGDFIKGIWHKGLFTKSSINTNSRFGYTYRNNLEECLWMNGTFKGADFYSGSGSTNHGISRWLDGTFENGVWHSGTFEDGEWKNGSWLDGIWATNSTPWVRPTAVWVAPICSTWTYDSNSATITGTSAFGSTDNTWVGSAYLIINSIDIFGNDIGKRLKGYIDINITMTHTVNSGNTCTWEHIPITQDLNTEIKWWAWPVFITSSGGTVIAGDYNICIQPNIPMWKDTNYLVDDELSGYSYFSYKNTTYEGFLDTDTLMFSGFSFDLYSLGTNARVHGAEVKIVRSAYYDHFNGGLIDSQINLDCMLNANWQSTVSGKSNNENTIPFSYNNTFVEETIFYGSRNDDWDVFPAFDYSGVNFAVLAYTPKVKYYPNITVTGKIYDVSIKFYYSTDPVWDDGTWYNGVWYNGTFKHGTFKNGMIFGGVFEDVDWS